MHLLWFGIACVTFDSFETPFNIITLTFDKKYLQYQLGISKWIVVTYYQESQ